MTGPSTGEFETVRFQFPKPLKGWRHLIGEVGIIVVGVLIALGAQQFAESIHDRSNANEARANVRAEAALDVEFLSGRLAYQNCIERRLDELSNILSGAGDGPLPRQPTWISRPPTGPFFTRRWEAATASGRNSLFAKDEQERFGMLYDIFARFNDYQAREQQVWSDLRALENWRGPLGPEARLSFAKDLQQAKYLAWDLSYAGRKAMEVATASGFVPPSSAGDRVAICLPIFTSRDVALRQLAGPYGQP